MYWTSTFFFASSSIFFGSSFICPPVGSLPPSTLELVGGGDGRGAPRLDVLQVAGVTEQVAVQGVAAVTFFIVQLHFTVLQHTDTLNYKKKINLTTALCWS